MTPRIELLWFDDCPNHEAARALVRNVVDELLAGAPIVDIDATDPAVAAASRFRGSPMRARSAAEDQARTASTAT